MIGKGKNMQDFDLTPSSPESEEETASENPVSIPEKTPPKPLFDPAAANKVLFADSEETISAESAPKEEKKEESPASIGETVLDWAKTFFFALIGVIFVFTLLARGVTVDGDSMNNTLQDRDYLVISNLFYTPKTGDIVVIQSPHYKNGEEPLLKRVIATGGQTVRINFRTWEVWVDGELLNEPYVLRMEGSSMRNEDLDYDNEGWAEVVVEENCVFVMGDNRNNSLDSRSDAIGQIDQRYIMGRLLFRLLPFEHFGRVN